MGLYPAFVLFGVSFSLYLQPGLCAVESPVSPPGSSYPSKYTPLFFLSSDFGLDSQLPTFGFLFPSVFSCSCLDVAEDIQQWEACYLLRQPTTLVDDVKHCRPTYLTSTHWGSTPPVPAACNPCSFTEQTPSSSRHPRRESLLKGVSSYLFDDCLNVIDVLMSRNGIVCRFFPTQ